MAAADNCHADPVKLNSARRADADDWKGKGSTRKEVEAGRLIDKVKEDLAELGSSIQEARDLSKDRQTRRSFVIQLHHWTPAGE